LAHLFITTGTLL